MKTWFTTLLILCSISSFAQNRFADFKQQGDSLMRIHRYDEAIAAYEQAEAIGARKIFMTRLYTDMARCYDLSGRYSDEMRCYEQLTSLVPDPNLTKVKMAEMQLRTGQYQAVADNLNPLPSDPRYEGQRITMLASAYYHLNQQEKAFSLIDSLISTHLNEKDDLYWNALNNKAFMLSSEGNRQDATPLYIQTLSHYQDNDPMKAVCLGNLALAEAHMGNKEAVGHIGQAIELIGRTYGTASHDYIILLRKKAEILLLLGMKTQATGAFKTFFQHEKTYIAENFRFMNEQQRRNYWKREQPLIAECYQLEDADPDFLLDVAVFSKSILYQPNIDHKDSEDFNKAFTTGGQTVRGALKEDECAVEFVTYKKGKGEAYGAIVAYSSRPTRFVPLFMRDSLLSYQVKSGSLSKPLDYCIAYTDKTMKNALYQDRTLYSLIWSRILKEGEKTAKVFFSPDADLHLLAVEYLPAELPRPQFYRLSSTRMLTERGMNEHRGKTLLVGGVDYAAKEMRPSESMLPDRRGSRQMSDDHILPRENDGFKYLKGSKTETDTIRAMLNSTSLCCLQGKDATEAQLKSLMVSQTHIHISTHGFCSDMQEPQEEAGKDSLREDKSLLRCGIILAGANKYAQQRSDNNSYEDGILTSREISELNLNKVRLAVLSACQTALGRTTENGMAGMPQGLKKAGVHTIIASLWHVDDEATTQLMTRFYHHLDDPDHPCTQEAFQRAQNELRQIFQTTTSEGYAFNPATLGRRKITRSKTTCYNDPFYWAPFIVIDGI